MSMHYNNFDSGKDSGFCWFLGVVECLQDPEKLGRAQVRVLGDHIQDKGEIPTEDLPWAMPMLPVTSASISGIGHSPTGLVQGSWVIGFYRDGTEKQQPIIIGSIGGLPLDPAKGDVGFNDPIECFPQEDKLEEPDTDRHARGVVGKHVVEPVPVTERKKAVMKGIATATMQWDEPETPYEPIYPYNQIWQGPYNPICDECEWGHIEEWDSTPGAERYFRQHKTSQNFLEIHPDGKEVRKIYGDGFEIDLATKHLYVEGDYRVTVMGNKDEYIKGDYWQHIEGDMIRVIDGDKIAITGGKDSLTTYKDTVRRTKGNLYEASEKSIMLQANDEIDIMAGSKIKAIAVDEIAIATGSYEPIVIEEPPPIDVTSDNWPEVILHCDKMNEAKSTIDNIIIPEIPPYDIISEAIGDTYIKIIPEKVFLKAEEFHDLAETFNAEAHNFKKDIYVELDANVLGDVYVGGMVDTPILHALEPMAIDPLGDHEYLVPTAPSAPIGPKPPEIPVDPDVEKEVNIPDKKYGPNEHIPEPVIPGEIYDCK